MNNTTRNNYSIAIKPRQPSSSYLTSKIHLSSGEKSSNFYKNKSSYNSSYTDLHKYKSQIERVSGITNYKSKSKR